MFFSKLTDGGLWFPPRLHTVQTILLNQFMFFRAALDSEQNLEEGTEISHMPPAPTHASPPLKTSSTRVLQWVKPSLPYHDPPKSLVCLRVHSWYCTFGGFGHRYNDISIIVVSHRAFSQPRKSSVFSLVFPLPTPCQSLIFYYVYSFTFSRMWYRWDHKHVAFLIGFFHLEEWGHGPRNMHLRFLHVFS